MPKIVNKEAVRIEIIEAFEHLSATRPLTDISLREIAAEAGISHTKLLRYFGSKTDLHIASVHWAAGFLQKGVARWFADNPFPTGSSERDYLDAFFEGMKKSADNGASPRSIVMTCALGAYSVEILEAIRFEYGKMKTVIVESLRKALGRRISDTEATAVLVVLNGVFFSFFNGSLDATEPARPLCALASFDGSVSECSANAI